MEFKKGFILGILLSASFCFKSGARRRGYTSSRGNSDLKRDPRKSKDRHREEQPKFEPLQSPRNKSVGKMQHSSTPSVTGMPENIRRNRNVYEQEKERAREYQNRLQNTNPQSASFQEAYLKSVRDRLGASQSRLVGAATTPEEQQKIQEQRNASLNEAENILRGNPLEERRENQVFKQLEQEITELPSPEEIERRFLITGERIYSPREVMTTIRNELETISNTRTGLRLEEAILNDKIKTNQRFGFYDTPKEEAEDLKAVKKKIAELEKYQTMVEEEAKKRILETTRLMLELRKFDPFLEEAVARVQMALPQSSPRTPNNTPNSSFIGTPGTPTSQENSFISQASMPRSETISKELSLSALEEAASGPDTPRFPYGQSKVNNPNVFGGFSSGSLRSPSPQESPNASGGSQNQKPNLPPKARSSKFFEDLFGRRDA